MTRRLYDTDPDAWWELAGKLSAELCTLVQQRLQSYGAAVPPGDGIGMMLIALGRFAGTYTRHSGASLDDTWAALLNSRELFASGFRTEKAPTLERPN